MIGQVVYLGLGSNLSDPFQQLKSAVGAIYQLPQTELIACSSVYLSQPMGPSDQPDYLNAVVQLQTQLTPEALLAATQDIEKKQGRVRDDQSWQARVLDIDILLYGTLIRHSEQLTIPHYGMREREFVLYPLAEISPDLTLPCGDLLKTVLETCPRRGLTRLDEIELANVIGVSYD